MTQFYMKYCALQQEIVSLARQAGRVPSNVTLIVVTKQKPIAFVKEIVATTSCRDLGENRVTELLEKKEELSDDIQWHFIGTLQRNKVSKIVDHGFLIHSVDTPALALKISQVAKKRQAVLLQVNTSKEESKHGLSPEEWESHLEEVFALPHLEIQGLMTMAPKEGGEKVIRSCFSSLRVLKEKWERRLGKKLPHLSMGMSLDYRIAIAEGATLIRVGRALYLS